MIIIKILLIIWAICSVGAFFQFVSDVRKWHDYEKKVTITPSNNEEVNNEESEVKEDVGNTESVSDAGESDTPTVLGNWL